MRNLIYVSVGLTSSTGLVSPPSNKQTCVLTWQDEVKEPIEIGPGESVCHVACWDRCRQWDVHCNNNTVAVLVHYY